MTENDGVDRRTFMGLLSAGAALGLGADGRGCRTCRGRASGSRPVGQLIDSPPVLQHPSATAVTVIWAVSAPATGWVEYGPTPELGRRAELPVYGLNPYDHASCRRGSRGLRRGSGVFYRVVCVPVDFKGPYKIVRGEAVIGEIQEFMPPNPAADRATFAVINDTHEHADTLAVLTGRLTAERRIDSMERGRVQRCAQ